MLYKSSDAENKPNMTVLSQLVEQHGENSEEVQAFLDLYANNKDFMSRALKIISSKKEEKRKNNDTSN